MKLKNKFKELEITVKSCVMSDNMMNNSAEKCVEVSDEYLRDFLKWLHSGQTYAIDLNDLIKTFKIDYEKRDS